jgi:hypothetical protein
LGGLREIRRWDDRVIGVEEIGRKTKPIVNGQ